MKAWFVEWVGNEDDGGQFVLAENRTDAKRKSEYAGDVDNWIVDLRARRAPKLDGKELTAENILAAGYGIICTRCETTVTDIAGISYDENQWVYCPECTAVRAKERELRVQ